MTKTTIGLALVAAVGVVAPAAAQPRERITDAQGRTLGFTSTTSTREGSTTRVYDSMSRPLGRVDRDEARGTSVFRDRQGRVLGRSAAHPGPSW